MASGPPAGMEWGLSLVRDTIAALAVATALMCAAAPEPASAQTLNDSIARSAKPGDKSRLLVEANELIYNEDRNTVSASGEVELNYQGRTLQADRVIYDRNTGRVHAEGNARMIDAAGAIMTADRFDLTDDFKTGFIDSLRVEQTMTERGQPVRTWLTAPRAERVEGESTVFERGSYTACEPCRENPERPPLWQVKASRVIHNNSEKTIYYEDARLEFAGVPVAYVPYFWSPDPTVHRQSGFLSPHYLVSTALGTGVAIPYFWNLAPNYDLTLIPTFYTRQGFLGEAEWRHRLVNGSYKIRAAGIFQQDQAPFLPAPFGARGKDARGSIETAGRFYINENWRYGWDVALVSDKWFLQNYKIHSESFSTNYLLRESTSTAYLQGQGDRSWFDLRGYYFQALSYADWQKQLPIVAPSLDYEKRFNGPAPIGGEVRVTANLTSLTRDTAQFQQLNGHTYLFGNVPGYTGIYETCSVFLRGQCLVKGLAGTFTRLSAEVAWRRDFVDSFGQVWTPFASIRADGFFNSPDLAGFQNAGAANFISGSDSIVGRAMPSVGVEYRYPFVADAGRFGIHTFEPIAQLIVRPNESHIGRLPNEDAHSLVFDDTTLFDRDKFSGFDRAEGGVRANYGAQYSVTTGNGFYANALFGQSYQVAGRNSFAVGDLLNTGLDSGLETRASDYVARLQVNPDVNYGVILRSRFDKDDFTQRSFEATVVARFKPVIPLTTSITYAQYGAQPELGYTHRREGLQTSAAFELTPRWSVNGSVIFDLDKYLDQRDIYTASYAAFLASPVGTAPVYAKGAVWSPTSIGIGFGYKDECTTFSINYAMSPRLGVNGETESDKTVLVRLELRSLGGFGYSQNVNGTTSADGISSR